MILHSFGYNLRSYFFKKNVGWSVLSRRLFVGRSVLSYYDQTSSPFRVAFKTLMKYISVYGGSLIVHTFFVDAKLGKKTVISKFKMHKGTQSSTIENPLRKDP